MVACEVSKHPPWSIDTSTSTARFFISPSWSRFTTYGARAPYVITRRQLWLMKELAVQVDVSIDQGGCFETSHPTTHSDPVYEVDGVTHYCVANMPGAVPVTSTFALTNATLPYVLALADHGLQGAIAKVPGLRPGVNVAGGKVTHPAVAEGTGMPYTPVEDVLGVTA